MDPTMSVYTTFAKVGTEAGSGNKEALLKNLSDKERATLKKVLEFVSGKTTLKPSDEEVQHLSNAIQRTYTLESPKIGFGWVKNLFNRDRISSKQLMGAFAEASQLQEKRTLIDALKSQGDGFLRKAISFTKPPEQIDRVDLKQTFYNIKVKKQMIDNLTADQSLDAKMRETLAEALPAWEMAAKRIQLAFSVYTADPGTKAEIPTNYYEMLDEAASHTARAEKLWTASNTESADLAQLTQDAKKVEERLGKLSSATDRFPQPGPGIASEAELVHSINQSIHDAIRYLSNLGKNLNQIDAREVFGTEAVAPALRPLKEKEFEPFSSSFFTSFDAAQEKMQPGQSALVRFTDGLFIITQGEPLGQDRGRITTLAELQKYLKNPQLVKPGEASPSEGIQDALLTSIGEKVVEMNEQARKLFDDISKPGVDPNKTKQEAGQLMAQLTSLKESISPQSAEGERLLTFISTIEDLLKEVIQAGVSTAPATSAVPLTKDAIFKEAHALRDEATALEKKFYANPQSPDISDIRKRGVEIKQRMEQMLQLEQLKDDLTLSAEVSSPQSHLTFLQLR